MGKFDKDIHQKELAIRFCLAAHMIPCLEVGISSASDLSDSVEILTDIDVLGLSFVSDGGFRRIIFDCKSGKMSSINRAFWASGVMNYTGCDEAFVITKNLAVSNHRLTALKIGVDLHDEQSFVDLGRTFDQAFDRDNEYQSSVMRWNSIYDLYHNTSWAYPLYMFLRNTAPISHNPWTIFRKVLPELRQARGYIDPDKVNHISIYFDILAGMLLLWSTMGRDIRRFYYPTISKGDFEKFLRYYLWGGKDSYTIRQELSSRLESGSGKIVELPSWDKLLTFAGLIINAPQELAGCVGICRNISIRLLCGVDKNHDISLINAISSNKRARQFIMSLSEYLVSACGLPKDMNTKIAEIMQDF